MIRDLTHLVQKITAPPGTSLHHKLAVTVPALAELNRVELLSGLNPPDLHFHRPRGDPALFSPMKVTPHVSTDLNNYEALEYVARNMFIAKSLPWPKAVGWVGETGFVDIADV